jgi:hypothetical protein
MVRKYEKKVPKVAPEKFEIVLPDGISIINRTAQMELIFRNKNKWLPVAQKLAQLTGTETVQIDLGDLRDMPQGKYKTNSIRSGIANAWVALGGKKTDVHSGVQGNKLYVWVNNH